MTDNTYSVLIDQDICMAAGYCYRAHPELFAVNPDGVAELVGGTPGPGPLGLAPHAIERARDAARACPSGAIQLIPAAGH